jgi:hypothetical protein
MVAGALLSPCAAVHRVYFATTAINPVFAEAITAQEPAHSHLEQLIKCSEFHVAQTLGFVNEALRNSLTLRTA